MEWQDNSILIKRNPFSEHNEILTIFTENRGVKKGIIRTSIKNKSFLHIGNILKLGWRGRLEEHLGKITLIDYRNIYPYIFDNNLKLHMIVSACNLANDLLQENEPHQNIFLSLINCLEHINSEQFIYHYIQFELTLLADLGYGLDLSKCAATETKTNLIYLSPKTGKAVSAGAGEQYKDKLFKLPQSFKKFTDNIEDNVYSLKLLRYFLEKNLYSIKGGSISNFRFSLEKLIAN